MHNTREIGFIRRRQALLHNNAINAPGKLRLSGVTTVGEKNVYRSDTQLLRVHSLKYNFKSSGPKKRTFTKKSLIIKVCVYINIKNDSNIREYIYTFMTIRYRRLIDKSVKFCCI